MDGNKPEPQGLLKILGAVFSGVLVALFLSKMRRLDNQERDDARTQDNTADRTRTRQNIPPSTVRVVIDSFPPSNTPPEQREAKRKHKQRRNIFNGIVKTGTILLLLSVAIISNRQLHTQVSSMKIDARPWIALTTFESHIRQPYPYYVVIPGFQDLGKTPALNITIRANYKIFPREHTLTVNDIEFRKERNDDSEVNAYYAGTFNPAQYPWGPRFHFEEEISEPTWKELMKGDKTFYVFFCLQYNDVFGRKLETHICGYYPVGLTPQGSACRIYNDTTPED